MPYKALIDRSGDPRRRKKRGFAFAKVDESRKPIPSQMTGQSQTSVDTSTGVTKEMTGDSSFGGELKKETTGDTDISRSADDEEKDTLKRPKSEKLLPLDPPI